MIDGDLADRLVDAQQRAARLEGRGAELRRRLSPLRAERDRLAAEAEGLARRLGRRGSRTIHWGDLERNSPMSSDWGFDRGGAIDRHYVERFLESRASDIRGAVLEVGEDRYSSRFGGDRVERREVVDIEAKNPAATIVADLRAAAAIPSASFDCFVMTQTLHLIDDMPAVLRESARILKPGGILLATFPSVARLEPFVGLDRDYWRLNAEAARRLVAGAFAPERIEVTSFGNLLASVAFLYGLGRAEVTADKLDRFDPRYPVTIAVRAERL